MSNESPRARFGPYEVDLRTQELWKFGTRLKLVGQPFSILAVLINRPGELVTREELRDRLWPSDTFVDFNHGLNAAMNKLRETLSDSATAPRFIETLPRRGYRFIAEIEWIAPKTAVTPVAPVEAPALVPPPARSRLVVGLFALLGLLVVGFVLYQTVSGRGSTAANLLKLSGQPQTKPLVNILGAFQPALSPDGNWVAFIREAPDTGEASVFVSAVGSNQMRRLSHGPGACCPVWSPDGHTIAFTRRENKEYSIHLLNVQEDSAQAKEWKLNTGSVAVRRGELDWSPDGKTIAFAGASGICLLQLEGPAVHCITQQPPSSEDWGPAFSPEGEQILFVRDGHVGQPDELWLTPVAGGDARKVLSEPGRLAGAPQWSSDGKSVVYASNRNGHPVLWRAVLDSREPPFRVEQAGATAWYPALSRRGYRLAYDRVTRSLGIWQIELDSTGEKRPHLLVSSTSESDQGPGPAFSPDGQKLAYMSDRSGTMEIWVSDRDGSNAYQLTAAGLAGTPRWSPDSKTIAFDSEMQTGTKVLTVSVAKGIAEALLPESMTGVCPNWSHDGKWIYFASGKTGEYQVWKIPAAGGTPVQITTLGGHAAWESPDGKTLFYAKNAMAEPEIWQVPVDGGAEKAVPQVRPGSWASWQVVDGGILFVGPSFGHQAVLKFFDLGTRRASEIANLQGIPFWLGATKDGKTIAFDQPGQEQAQAMLIENFH